MSPHEQWIAFVTIFVREVRRFTRIWVQTIVPAAITTILYFVIFGTLMGERIGVMDGFKYIQFVAPGLIMMAVITNSYGNVVSSFYGNKYQRSLEEILVSPTPNYVILAGFVFGGVVRGLLVGLLVTLVALFFTNIPVHNLGIVILTVFLTAVLFALAGILNGIFARNFDDISVIPTFVLTPLTYLGGVFYSVSLLPDVWRNLSMLNPILYMVNAFRYGFLSVSDINVYLALTIISVFIVILTVYALYLLRHSKKLRS